MPTEVTWSKHDELETGWQSDCGTFEIQQDPTYGYFKLLLSEDTTESLAEDSNEANLMSNPHQFLTPSAA